jgi:hypothetical protein
MTEVATPVNAQTRSAELRARLALARTIQISSRGQCYRHSNAKTGPAPLSFSDVAAIPDWLSWDSDSRCELALASAILYHRPAIDRELSGVKLGALADRIGREIFDHLCNEELDETINPGFLSEQFPRPEDLDDIGERLLSASLPKTFCSAFPAATGDEQARKLVAFAAALAARIDVEIPTT